VSILNSLFSGMVVWISSEKTVLGLGRKIVNKGFLLYNLRKPTDKATIRLLDWWRTFD